MQRINKLPDHCQILENGALSERWEQVRLAYSRQVVMLEFPASELLTPRILKFVLAWRLQDTMEVCEIDGRDHFEGATGQKIRIKTNLLTALLLWQDLPGRCQIWSGDLPVITNLLVAFAHLQPSAQWRSLFGPPKSALKQQDVEEVDGSKRRMTARSMR